MDRPLTTLNGPRAGCERNTVNDNPLVVFSHLRWDAPPQRPHHLLPRFAEHRTVLYVEEPVHVPGEPARWEFRYPALDLIVCRPRTPLRAQGFCSEQLPVLRRLLLELTEHVLTEPCTAWVYTPDALPLARTLAPELLVYDCMEDPLAVPGAPPDSAARELELLRAADVVFTSGPTLYAARRHHHRAVYCFPNSVDTARFRRATVALGEPADQQGLRRPRFGYMGMIDERLDAPLLAATAAARPQWELVFVGPGELPAPLRGFTNIHHLGPRPHDALPAYLAGWDAALLPMAGAPAAATPPQTLEYMAAERPIVATRIPDLVALYGDVVHLATTPAEFIGACEAALRRDAEAQTRRARAREILWQTSWDSLAAAMHRVLLETAERRRRRFGRAATDVERMPNRADAASPMR